MKTLLVRVVITALAYLPVLLCLETDRWFGVFFPIVFFSMPVVFFLVSRKLLPPHFRSRVLIPVVISIVTFALEYVALFVASFIYHGFTT